MHGTLIYLSPIGSRKKEYKPPQTIIIHLSKIPMPELQPKAPPKPGSSPPQTSSTSRPMNWFGFGAGPSDAKSSNTSLDKSKSTTNLRPDSGTVPKLRPNSSYASSSDSTQAKPPKPPPSPAPPKDKNRKEKEKKDKLKKTQDTPQKPPQASPHSAWPGPKPGSFGGSNRPSPSSQTPNNLSSTMPGAFPPPTSPSGQNFYGSGFPHSFPQPSHKPPPNPPAGFPPPSVPPPGPGPGTGGPQLAQPQPVGLTGALTNQLANVGYSLLDRLTHNTPSSRPK